MKILLLLLTMTVLQESPGFPYPDFVLEYHPKTVMPGDTLYMKIIANNHHTESVYIKEQFYPFTSEIQICLRDSENQTHFLLFEGISFDDPTPPTFVEMKPGASRIICWMSINVPPLEDLNDPFWEKHLKNLSESPKGETLSLCIAFRPRCLAYREYEHFIFQFTFETPLVLELRPEHEMRLIRNWFEDTPNELFPTLSIGDNPTRKIPPGRTIFPRFENVLVKGEKVRQGQFMRPDNRYPGYPNAPETWQEWQELEENLTPSTMQNEIRWTRILMQYCDTEDVAVLKELKDWFTDMNEVQRIVLANKLRIQTSAASPGRGQRDYLYHSKFFSHFREAYKTIREYDVVPIPESNVKHLQSLGLIE